jgi:acetylornithine deacetylase/succinyl-diaminopimelate desuccinylase-like protein
VRRAAEFLAENLRGRVGLENVEVIETKGHPLVYAEWLNAPGKPTVLIYGHYDVQPVDPLELWRTPPFEPTLEGENLRARGAVDDKGPMFANLKALETLMQTNSGKLPVNVKVLIEGEEESGGASIAEYVENHPEHLAADYALVLDTSMVEKGVPTISHALRGIMYAELVARGAAGDLHSGVYGGIAPNPLQTLAWALAELKGRNGRINIPGLYELARPLSDEERQALENQSKAQEQPLKAAAGLSELPGENGFSIAERASARPTFEVHGIIGGFTGAGAKTVIPAEATAKISLRLVPGQNPDKVFELLEARVKELAAPGAALELRPVHGGDAVLLPLDSPVLQIAARALENEFNRPVAFQREGGSIPIVAQFAQELNLPVVMYGFGLVDDNIHAPNEKFYLPNFYHAIRTVAGFLTLLSNEE